MDNKSLKHSLKHFLRGEVRFSQELFESGDSVFSPVICWQWLTYPSESEIKRQLDAAKQAGFGTVYILPMPGEFRPDTMVTELDGYLSESYFEKIRYALEYADSAGLRLWLYDEGGWPSGSACGKVAESLPDRRAAHLRADENGNAFFQKQNGKTPDIYDETAAECFTKLTHHAYAKALGFLAQKVEAMFTDEPSGSADAVSERLLDAFFEKYGYAMEPYFDALLSPETADAAGIRARQDYYNLLCEKITGTLNIYRRAGERYGWLSVGHLDRDHTADSNLIKGYGNTLRALKALDIPGVDAINGQILSSGNQTDANAVDFYPRFASSAAVQKGTPLSLSESFAVYGNSLSGDEMRYILNYQLVRGINMFNFMTMPSTLSCWYAYSERPYFHPDIPGFFALDSLCKELERECFFMATGLHAAKTALLYPYEDIIAGAERGRCAINAFRLAGNKLEADGVDFDIIDSDTILSSGIEKGMLIAGGAVYAEIVIPDGCDVSDELQMKIKRLRGKARQFVKCSQRDFLHRTVIGSDGVLHICIFNQSRETKTADVFVYSDLPVYRCDPRTGKMSGFINGDRITLAYGECALLLATDAEIICRQTDQIGHTVPLIPEFAAKTAEFRLSEEGAKLVNINKNLPLPSAGAELPPEFCGEASFGYSFYSDGMCDCVLSFETLRYFAQVYVNAERAGSVCTAPYRLDIDKKYLHNGRNTLTVKISALAASAYAHTDAEKFYEKKYIGPYHASALEFEKNMPGGEFAGLRLEQLTE